MFLSGTCREGQWAGGDMGSIPLVQLFPRQATTTDDAREVGAIPLRMQVSAMCVGKDGSGNLVYKKEVPIYLATAWRVVDDAEDRHRWWRLEAKVETRNDGIRPHHELVVAEHPYSGGWLHHVPFKPGSKKGAEERAEFSSRQFHSLAAAIAACEALAYDFWEKGNYLTAGISQPELPFDPNDPPRNVQKQALYVFGSCESLSAHEEALLRSKPIEELLRQTDAGTLKFWFKDAELAELPQLFDEVKEDAWSLMMLSVRQALAGPHRDGEAWIGRPVAEKVDQIYRGHINARNRRVAEERNRLEPYDDFQRDTAGEDSDDENNEATID
jgi:hypothetical protein